MQRCIGFEAGKPPRGRGVGGGSAPVGTAGTSVGSTSFVGASPSLVVAAVTAASFPEAPFSESFAS